jgi:hypothetical protein
MEFLPANPDHVVMTNILNDRDWSVVGESFYKTSPYNYIVIDDFLNEDYLSKFHEDFLNHWAWRQKNWLSSHLHNRRPAIPQFKEIATALKSAMPDFFGAMELVDHWGLMYPKNSQGRLHADIGGLATTLWLTPDQYNLNKEAGGLIIHDVKRPPRMFVYEGLVEDMAEKYLAEHTSGDFVRIPYRCNRLVLFDGCNFHKTDELNFDTSEPKGFRMNASFAFSERAEYLERMRPYTDALKAANEPRN